MLNSPPIVSVITVVYNGAKTIEDTILSVVNQTFDNYEYLIIDGGSKDGTIDFIKKYENKITKWISEKDHGIYEAMNKGVSIAKGNWICFINADDTFYNNEVLKLTFDKQYDLDTHVLYGSTEFENSKGIKSIVKPKWLSTISFSMPFAHTSSFVRRDVLVKRPFSLTYSICADFHFFFLYYRENAHSFRKIGFPISSFAYGGVSTKSTDALKKECLEIITLSGGLSGHLNRLLYTLLLIKRRLLNAY